MGIGTPPVQEHDQRWMGEALKLARQAFEAGEVPVGAIVIDAAGDVLGQGWNQPLGSVDPTAHAEITALRAAAARRGNYRLTETTMYVTVEPCMMCAGALIHARLSRLVYGAVEPKAGAVHTHNLMNAAWLNHRVDAVGGVLADACGNLMSDFFAARRRESDG